MPFKPFGKGKGGGKGYEGSKADKAEDKAQAKKRGVGMKAWEKSPADKKMDAAGGGGFPAFRRGGKVKRGK